ncbi:hypothetical protein P170DRAFT_482148 [Aspergillus steynii IBT 23096]|uniref:Uncharacterized protein n=1 Tax=Aspergillus steynii IBT 23096 TaxID=1392250 RepID=A0A2I2GM52_9EURO|nr:uncharacterized protein P170DRAFT_482148 [Aspergillus steynii IBT 23096]PLB53954.1 hypothetical protein P170DRAFT_482148 [Aspergillus steynii IBT 23096]
MAFSLNHSVAELGSSQVNPLPMSFTEESSILSADLPIEPTMDSLATSRIVLKIPFAPKPTTASPEPVQSSSSTAHSSSFLGPKSPTFKCTPLVIKDEWIKDEASSSSSDKEMRPPAGKRPRRWHRTLASPSVDGSNRSRHRSIAPSPPFRLRSRSPRSRAIYERYRPNLRVASVLDTDLTADGAYETHVQATRNVHIARIERLRAREDIQEAILELDRFELELAKQKLEECHRDYFKQPTFQFKSLLLVASPVSSPWRRETQILFGIAGRKNLSSRSDLLLALEHHQQQTPTQSWPPFFRGSPTLNTYLPRLIDYTGLLRYQYVMVWQDHTGQETLVANAYSMPFFWPELAEFQHRKSHDSDTAGTDKTSLPGEDGIRVLDTLPDGGYETILARAVEQFFVRQNLPAMSPPLTHDQARDMPVRRRREAPNALVVLSVGVYQEWRGQGLVGRMVEFLKDVARRDELGVVITPLRPAAKVGFPTADTVEYLGWRKETGPQGVVLLLVKHVALGGRVVRIARSSVSVMGDVAAWESWTGMDIRDLVASETEDTKMEKVDARGFVHICIPGALVPVRYYLRSEQLVYAEPSVWVYHDVTDSR